MLNDDQFRNVLSEREQAEISGRALGGHIFSGLEDILGGEGAIRQSFLTEAWADAHRHYQGEDVRPNPDDDDYPTLHVPLERGLHARYPVGGPYVTIYHGDEPVEALHVNEEDRLKPRAVKDRARGFDPTDYGY